MKARFLLTWQPEREPFEPSPAAKQVDYAFAAI
jgi:hypothetical protein